MPAKKPKKKQAKRDFKTRRLNLEVVGLQYRVTKPVRRMLRDHLPFEIELVRETDNTHDPNAIAVVVSGEIPYKGIKLGYLRKTVAAVLAAPFDEGDIFGVEARIEKIHIDEGTADAVIWLNYEPFTQLDKLPKSK